MAIRYVKYKGFHAVVVQVNEKDVRTELKYIVGLGNPFWVNSSEVQAVAISPAITKLIYTLSKT